MASSSAKSRARAPSKTSDARKSKERWQKQNQLAAEIAVGFMGSNVELARILDVARTQPGRWVKGEEQPSPAIRHRLQDLSFVMMKVSDVWGDDYVMDWMLNSNAFLDDARPIDVLLRHGPADVIDAIEAERANSYA